MHTFFVNGSIRPRPGGGRRRILTVCAALSVLLAACADPERELEAATADAFATQLPFVDEVGLQCLAEGYVADLGVDGYQEHNVDSVTLVTEPETVLSLLTADSSAAANCLDLAGRLGGLLSAEGGDVTPDCLVVELSSTRALADELLEAEPGLDALDGPASDQLVDSIRGCVDDHTFAHYAGLSDPDELREVLNADPFTWMADPDDQDQCVVDVVIDTIGIERLDELGVTVDAPEFGPARVRLTDTEYDQLADAYAECDLDRNLHRAISWHEEQVADCVMDLLDDDAKQEMAVVLTKGYNPVLRTFTRDLIHECADQAVEAIFGDQVEAQDQPSSVRSFLNEISLNSAQTTTSVFEHRCMTAGWAETVDETTVAAIGRADAAYASGQWPEPDDEAIYQDLLERSTILGTTCYRPWQRMQNELEWADVGKTSWPCIRRTLDPGLLEAGMEATAAALWQDDAVALSVLMQAYDDFAAAVQTCGTSTDVRNWSRFVDDLWGYSEEPLGQVDSA